MAFLKSANLGGAAADASGHEDLLLKLVQFVCGVGYPTFSGAGGVRARYARARASAVSETWTITCTNAGTGTFSVVGSVSGAAADATVGTPYDNGKVAFTLTNISGSAVLADAITVSTVASTMTATGQCWELIKQVTDPAGFTNSKHVFLRGLGLAGTDQIYVNIRSYYDTPGDYYNLALYGASGYLESTANVTLAPGSSSATHVCAISGAIPYVFVANGRHFKFIAKMPSVYESAYCGFILPTGTPSEYPYPLAIGGSHYAANRRYSDSTAAGTYGAYHRAFFNPGGSLYLRRKDGSWSNFANYNTSDIAVTTTTGHYVAPFHDINMNRAIDGSYILFPTTLHSGTPADVLGDFEGVYMISGYSNASENIAQVGGVDHFVVQNTFRTNTGDFAAFKLS